MWKRNLIASVQDLLNNELRAICNESHIAEIERNKIVLQNTANSDLDEAIGIRIRANVDCILAELFVYALFNPNISSAILCKIINGLQQ